MPDDIQQQPQSATQAPLDFQEHLARLEAQGLLVRVTRAINKDTELQPLVRWQFVGGIPEDERRAFLFTNVVDAKGRRYDIPVALGALAGSPRIYALGMGRPVDKIGETWVSAIANPIAPVTVESPACQQVVITGDALREPGGGLARLPVPISTPGFDSAPYLTATLCVTRDPENGIQNMGTYRAALKATDRLGVRMAARVGGAGGYLHWLKYRARKEPMPIAIVLGCAPVVFFTGPQKLALDNDELTVAGGLAGAPIRKAKCVTIDLEVPADAEIVIEGIIDTSVLEPEAPFGESNGYVALEAYNMPMRVTAITHKRSPVFTAILSQVTPSESCVVKKVAYEPMFLLPSARQSPDPQRAARGDARAALESAAGHLRAVRAGSASHRGLARAARRGDAARRLRQDRDRGERGHRPGRTPTPCSGRSPTARPRRKTW
jgi:4-hydroxy-3-polyprenylbenzoate decarboxylase